MGTYLVAQAVKGRERQGVNAVHAGAVDIIPDRRRQPQPLAQVQQDVGRLVQHQVAVAQDGRREDGHVAVLPGMVRVNEGQHVLDASLAVLGARLLQRQPDMLAAPRDAWPI